MPLGGDQGTERDDVREQDSVTQKGSISEEERESSAFQKESNLMFIILMCHYKQQNLSFTDMCMAFQADFCNKGKLLIRGQLISLTDFFIDHKGFFRISCY